MSPLPNPAKNKKTPIALSRGENKEAGNRFREEKERETQGAGYVYGCERKPERKKFKNQKWKLEFINKKPKRKESFDAQK